MWIIMVTLFGEGGKRGITNFAHAFRAEGINCVCNVMYFLKSSNLLMQHQYWELLLGAVILSTFSWLCNVYLPILESQIDYSNWRKIQLKCLHKFLCIYISFEFKFVTICQLSTIWYKSILYHFALLEKWKQCIITYKTSRLRLLQCTYNIVLPFICIILLCKLSSWYISSWLVSQSCVKLTSCDTTMILPKSEQQRSQLAIINEKCCWFLVG